MKALLVDGKEFLPELQEILRDPDMDVDFARNFEEAIALLTIKSYDIVIRSDKKPLI